MSKKSSPRGGIFDLLSWAVGLSGEGEGGFEMLSLDEIVIDRRQPRRHFDQASLEQLANSIRANGVIEPVLVRKLDGGGYQLIAGERRWRAARLAGNSEIPALISASLLDSDIKKFQLIENLMREDLNPIEEVYAYLDLIAARLATNPAGKHLLAADLHERRARLIELLRELAVNKKPVASAQRILSETVVAIFNEIGHISWQEFVTRRLSALKLPAELLTALNEGWLSYQQALLLSRVNARAFGPERALQERQKLLAWVKRSSPSMAELRARVQERRDQLPKKVSARSEPTLPARLNETARRLQAIKLARRDQLPKKLQTRMERALQNLEILVESLEQENSVIEHKKISINGKNRHEKK
jgi:ParB family chromosome partitioning protein